MQVTDVKEDSIVFQVNFDHPTALGTHEKPDVMSIYLDFADIDPTFYGESKSKIEQIVILKVFPKDAAQKV